MGSVLHGQSGQGGSSSRQYALGAEIGYAVATNLWASLGYNATGFHDKDLSGSDYTNKGVYLRLRYKFDEDLFKGRNTQVNRSLSRDSQPAAK